MLQYSESCWLYKTLLLRYVWRERGCGKRRSGDSGGECGDNGQCLVSLMGRCEFYCSCCEFLTACGLRGSGRATLELWWSMVVGSTVFYSMASCPCGMEQTESAHSSTVATPVDLSAYSTALHRVLSVPLCSTL